MGMEMRICQCGQEFEDSEFGISLECDECRYTAPPPLRPPPDNFISDQLIRRMEQAYYEQRQAMTRQYETSYEPPQNLTVTTGLNAAGGPNGVSHYRQNPDGTFTVTYEQGE